jgi:hypothetical protein
MEAHFARWEPLIYFDDGSTIPLCFIPQLPDKLTPSDTHLNKTAFIVSMAGLMIMMKKQKMNCGA